LRCRRDHATAQLEVALPVRQENTRDFKGMTGSTAPSERFSGSRKSLNIIDPFMLIVNMQRKSSLTQTSAYALEVKRYRDGRDE
jgi:hypothetical protein